MAAAPEHDKNGQPVTDQAIAVPDRLKGVTTFTPEQVEAARSYADASRAASTRAKYLQHWTAFGRWCQETETGHQTLPAEPAVVAVHLSGLAAAGTAPQTLALRMAAIGYAHRQAGEVPPHKVRGGTVILDILAGARRSWGKPPARKAAADGDLIWSMTSASTSNNGENAATAIFHPVAAVEVRHCPAREPPLRSDAYFAPCMQQSSLSTTHPAALNSPARAV